MSREGPALEGLLHRLAECPPEFLLSPSEIDVVALVCDHLRLLSAGMPSAAQRQALQAVSPEHQRLIAVTVWLLHDDWFLAHAEFADATMSFLRSSELTQLSKLVRAEVIVSDSDRREELIRLCLHALGLRPSGESIAQAADRLTTLDSVERDRVIHKTRAAEARAREIRGAMARKAAEEAAARYSPE